MDGDDALAALVGGHLDTVSFVTTYVEFRIGYSVLRALRSPLVELSDGTVAQFPEPGSRDALCRVIGTEVVAAYEVRDDTGERIEVRTSAGDLISIDIGGHAEPEFAHLVPADARGRLMVSEMYVW